MLAREIMIPEPVVAAAGATSAEVALLMRAKDISVVPVVDNPKDRRYLGTISDRDIVTQCVAAGPRPNGCSRPVAAPRRTAVGAPGTAATGGKVVRAEEDGAEHRTEPVGVGGNQKGGGG